MFAARRAWGKECKFAGDGGTFTNPFRPSSTSPTARGFVSRLSRAPPTTIMIEAPGPRRRLRSHEARVTSFTPSPRRYSRKKGTRKFMDSVSSRRSMPGNSLSNPVASVAKLQSAPVPSNGRGRGTAQADQTARGKRMCKGTTVNSLQGGGGGLRSGSVKSDCGKWQEIAGKSRCRTQTSRSLKEQHLCNGDTQGTHKQRAIAGKLRENCGEIAGKLRENAQSCKIAKTKNAENGGPQPPPTLLTEGNFRGQDLEHAPPADAWKDRTWEAITLVRLKANQPKVVD